MWDSTGASAKRRTAILLTFLLGQAWPAGGEGMAVAVVLSSDLVPYQQALAGFEKSYGKSVPTYHLSREDPPTFDGHPIAVAFGGKAAIRPYPASVRLVACLTPGLSFKDLPPSTIVVRSLPRPVDLIVQLKELQPAGARLTAIWLTDLYTSYVRELGTAAADQGLQLKADRLTALEELPSHLRRLIGTTDALWIPPDPYILDAQTFALIRDFSIANRLPLYVALPGLVEQGATASYAPSFHTVGSQAAIVAQRLEQGLAVFPDQYPDNNELVINPTSARQTGITLSDRVLQKARQTKP